MLCQNCKKQEATTHIKRIVNGESTEAHLCADCAKSLGYSNAFSDFGFGFSDMLSSLFEPAAVGRLSNSVLRCEKCGCSFNDIVKSGKVGCADCYETFYDKLMPSVERIHGRTQHEGKIPNGSPVQKKNSRIDELREQLQNAVNLQDYETAASLRDQIKALEQEGTENG